MKISYECSDLIKEIVKDCQGESPDSPCVVFAEKETGIFKDYLLKIDIKKNNIIYMDEKRVEMPLFSALTAFISQNDITERPPLSVAIYAARCVAGLSQAALAERLKVKQQQVARWENGGRNPKLENVLKVAEETGIDAALILGVKK